MMNGELEERGWKEYTEAMKRDFKRDRTLLMAG